MDLNASDAPSASARLAAFVAASRPADLPHQVVHESKRAILNAFGAALGAWSDPASTNMLPLLASLSGPPAAGVIGRPARLDILNAAFLNAQNVNLLDFDDTHLPTIIHPAAPVLPPLLALAERDDIDGPTLLHAFALGLEVTCRLGNAVHPGHYRRGWHITATCGVVGAAAAAARLLGLSATQIGHAIGIAACQAGGLVENLPHEAKNVQVGNSARNGLFAALTAQIGYRSAATTLEGGLGWGRATGQEIDESVLLQGLGESWQVSRNTYKAYPCGIVLAPVIDACLALRDEVGPDADRIEEVAVRGHPLLIERADRPDVLDDRTAKLSLQHACAVALLFGAAGPAEFSSETIRDPGVVRLRRRVRAQVDEAITVDGASVTVRLSGGRTVTRAVTAARGSIARPLSDGEIESKVRDLARLGSPAVSVAPLIDAVWQLDRLENAGRLVSLSQPGAA